MGRPGKVKVDYFPHVTHTGKTMAVLETRWGNDGYAFWFKLLELIGDTDGFCYNCNNLSDWEYLLAKTRVSSEIATAILNKLAEIEAIDAGLWQEKWVWSDNFVAGVAPAFEKRKSELPQKPGLRGLNPACSEVSGAGNPPADDGGDFPGPETGKGEERNGDERNGDERRGTESDTEQRVSRRAAKKQRRKKNPAPDCPSKMRQEVEAQADTVYLKPEEVDRLTLEYGADGARRMVEILDAYKTNHPDKCAQYRDDYKVITAWVITRYLEEQGAAGRSARDSPLRGGAPERQSFAMAKLEQLAKEAAEHDAV